MNIQDLPLLKSRRYLLSNFSKSLLGGFIFGTAQHIYRLFKSQEYRYLSLCRLKYAFIGRYQETKVKLSKREITVPDIASFLSMYEEIYFNQIYKIPMEPSKILDLGANIGLSILWLKEHYPHAEITGYEADKNIFKNLRKNTKGLLDIKIHNEAVWHKDTELSFSPEGADGGRVDDRAKNDKSLVKARDIRCILKNEGPFSFIKMDIEGAESTVLPACRGLLDGTTFLFCEYHSIENEPQNLDVILNVLREEGFRIHIQSVSTSKQPFMFRKKQAGFDLQLNIFGWKKEK